MDGAVEKDFVPSQRRAALVLAHRFQLPSAGEDARKASGARKELLAFAELQCSKDRGAETTRVILRRDDPVWERVGIIQVGSQAQRHTCSCRITNLA